MDGIETLGKSGDVQAYRVTSNNVKSIVFFNEVKMTGECVECHSKRCEHIDLILLTYELEVNKFKWINIIAYTLERYNRTNIRRLWALITDGMISPRHPLRAAMQDHHSHVLMPLVWKYGLPFKSKENREKCIQENPKLKEAFQKMEELKKTFEDRLLSVVNGNFERMTIYECGYLSLLRINFMAEFGIDEDFLHPNWHNGQEWLFDSEAFWVLYNQNEFIVNDEQNELLRQNLEERKSISTG